MRLPVDVLVAAGTPSHLAAAQTTDSIPVVTTVGDPVGDGLADSLARPGRNVTGLSSLSLTLAGKRLQQLHETVLNTSRVAVLWNANASSKAAELKETQTAAQRLGLKLTSLGVRRPEEFEDAFETASRSGAEALIVMSDAFTTNYATQIARMAVQSKLPTMSEVREFVIAGGLMSYGPDLTVNYQRAAYYVDRILKGAKPADLPIEQPMRFIFALNTTTAAALGLTIPNHILLQVTEVVQ